MANIVTTPEEIFRAQFRKYKRRSANKMAKQRALGKKRGKGNVRTVSGGLPSLGKRR